MSEFTPSGIAPCASSRRTAQRSGRGLALLAAVSLALAPAMAEARPGGGFSSGSRGSRTYSAPPSTNTAPNGGANTFQRTETPRGAPTTPGVGQTAPTYRPAPAGGMGGGFMAGMMGGLLGAGLAGMLFGGGFGGMSGFSGFLGFLLQIALLAGIAMLVVRFFRRRAMEGAMRGGPAAAMAGGAPNGGTVGAGGYARTMNGGNGLGGAMAGGRAPATTPVEVGGADFEQFERSLVEVNAAWSKGDRAALARLATPEMQRYFASDLDDLAQRGWRNETRDVRLESGDLSEAWRENGTDYATVAMRFSLVDVTRDATGTVVEGDATARQTVTELWTFARRGGSAWLLSAIQQAR